MNYKRLFFNIKNQFLKSSVVTLASSSSFFFILTFVPTVLLVTRLFGFILGGQSDSLEIIAKYIGFIVPENLSGVIPMIKRLVAKSMFASGSYTIFNFIILGVSSLGFVNSIWRNLAIITEDNSYNSVKKYYRGIGAILIALSFVMTIFFLPMILNGVLFLANKTPIMAILAKFNILSIFEESVRVVNRFDAVSYIFTSIFMIVLFKYILFSKVSTKSAAVGAVFFTVTLGLIKSSFYLYANLVSSGLLKNYGASYIIVLMYVWVFVAMILFYSSIILSIEIEKEADLRHEGP